MCGFLGTGGELIGEGCVGVGGGGFGVPGVFKRGYWRGCPGGFSSESSADATLR